MTKQPNEWERAYEKAQQTDTNAETHSFARSGIP